MAKHVEPIVADWRTGVQIPPAPPKTKPQLTSAGAFSLPRKRLDLSPLAYPVSKLRRKRIALSHIPALEPTLEPFHTLGGGAMGEAVRYHLATAALLQAVVADGGGGLQGFLQIARLQQLAVAVRGVAPDAGQAVGLQLLAHRQGIDHGGGLAPAGGAHFLTDAQQRLDVVADFMGNYIGLGEIAGGAELAFQILEKAQVEIDLAVRRAVERTDGGAGRAAG